MTLEGLIPISAKVTLSEANHDGSAVSMKGRLGSFSGVFNQFGVTNDVQIEIVSTTGTQLQSKKRIL